jgi:hypothetical protein
MEYKSAELGISENAGLRENYFDPVLVCQQKNYYNTIISLQGKIYICTKNMSCSAIVKLTCFEIS